MQPIEIVKLEYIRNKKYNQKLYNLIQNTLHEFSPDNEELKTIRALELHWPLLQTKNVIRMLANLLTSSTITRTNFPNGFYEEDNPL